MPCTGIETRPGLTWNSPVAKVQGCGASQIPGQTGNAERPAGVCPPGCRDKQLGARAACKEPAGGFHSASCRQMGFYLIFISDQQDARQLAEK